MRTFSLSLMILVGAVLQAADGVGRRPYELDWAGRLQDDHPALVDFERDESWQLECTDAEASFSRSREQQIWGDYVGKLTYRREGGTPVVTLRPPQPLSLPPSFNMVGCWIYGNNWAWVSQSDTPQVNIALLFSLADGSEYKLHLTRVNWREWFLPIRRLTAEQEQLLSQPETRFTGFQITNGRNRQDRMLFFDSLTFFTDEQPPLSFQPRPKRNLRPFPGQSHAANTGPGVLPFPTREETILPDSAQPGSQNSITSNEDSSFLLRYQGPDGSLSYRYAPANNAPLAITAQWQQNSPIRLFVNGGVQFPSDENPYYVAAEEAELIQCELIDDAIISQWRLQRGQDSIEVRHELRIMGKSLVVDTLAPGGKVGALCFGELEGLQAARAVEIPYYDYANGRPAVLVFNNGEDSLFASAHLDWYRSNGSLPWGAGKATNTGDGTRGAANGGVRYIARTDGQRNDCFERFFITVGPEFAEHLPNIPNPSSPHKHITGTRAWRAHGAGNRDRDKQYWRNIWRHGMRQVLVTDHETCWRDGGESFTFRTKAAPGKGGDAGMADYSRYMQDELGFVYGPYNNFTDFAPVNEHWRVDLISRTATNQLQGAWARCYAPKPQYAVEYCAELSPINQEKYRFSTAYCDVHTSVTPWGRTDYDHRVPGAGSFAATYYAFGEIMLIQKACWQGPVYSEGPHHCFYSGLTDGNYAQDRNYYLPERPWLVDFDLRKIHPLECNFGMGNMEMFYGKNVSLGDSTVEVDANIDRFMAATVAFGHPSFLLNTGGMRRTLRGYFLLQQLHSRYTQAEVARIRYADADGRLWDSSQAIANRAYERSQLVVDYQDGTHVVVNGHRQEDMSIKLADRELVLPANGFVGWTDDGQVNTFSGRQQGLRADYADSPDYLYVDGRDLAFQRFPKAAGMGAGVCRREDAEHWEVILYEEADCGFAINAVGAEALDFAGQSLGPAKLRRSRGLCYVIPVPGAFSYRLREGMLKGAPELRCEQDSVVAGEKVRVYSPNGQSHDLQIAADAQTGQRLWFEIGGGWIDFTVQDLMRCEGSITDSILTLRLLPSKEGSGELLCRVGEQQQRAPTQLGQWSELSFSLQDYTQAAMRLITANISDGQSQQRWQSGLISSFAPKRLALDFSKNWHAVLRARHVPESNEFASSGARVERQQAMSCGDVLHDGLFMHPPWKNQSGAVAACYELELPSSDEAQFFRALVGKRDGSHLGDGILFQVVARQADGEERILAEHTVAEHRWEPISADLSAYAGQKITLLLISDVGPEDDSTGDWACWAELRIESKQQCLNYELDPVPERYAQEAPEQSAALSPELLASAVRGWLCYEGQGFDSRPESYPSTGSINGLDIGLLSPATGNETINRWSEEQQVPIAANVLRNIKVYNSFTLYNPNRDYFKIRRFRILLELADGRQISSYTSTAVFTQPIAWAHSEGILVSFNKNIVVPIAFVPFDQD
jgi:hypothetical protein